MTRVADPPDWCVVCMGDLYWKRGAWYCPRCDADDEDYGL